VAIQVCVAAQLMDAFCLFCVEEDIRDRKGNVCVIVVIVRIGKITVFASLEEVVAFIAILATAIVHCVAAYFTTVRKSTLAFFENLAAFSAEIRWNFAVEAERGTAEFAENSRIVFIIVVAAA